MEYTAEQIAALVKAAQAANEQLTLIAIVNGTRAIRKGQIEHSGTLRKLHDALAPFEMDDES